MHLSSAILTAFLATTTVAGVAPTQFLAKRGDLRGFDVSSPQPAAFWSCASKAGYNKVAIRGYSQACGSGGSVDKNFAATYKAARAGGFTHIDAYMFPCTGRQPNGVACKPIHNQIQEFIAAVSSNRTVMVERLWFDIEPSSGACNAWNLSKVGNLALAKQWVAALKATCMNWGIYGNGNQWTAMFPSRASDVGSDLPLWAVQADSKEGVSSVHTFMGGWTSAAAKQFHLDTKTPECGGSLDLDSFSG